MSVIEAIKKRSSQAQMSDKAVSPDLIREILNAAVCTPVHYHTDPWRFLVLTGVGRKKLGDVTADYYLKTTGNKACDENFKILENIRAKALRAPVIIVVGAAKTDHETAMMREDVASVSASCQNILLAASELGLNAIWRTGCMIYEADTAPALGFEAGTALVGFIYLGHPVRDMPSKSRPTAAAFTRWMTE